MKWPVKPVSWSLNITMFYRIVIDVIHMRVPVRLVPQQMFPESSLIFRSVFNILVVNEEYTQGDIRKGTVDDIMRETSRWERLYGVIPLFVYSKGILRILQSIKYIYWQDVEYFLGHFVDYPDYVTQGGLVGVRSLILAFGSHVGWLEREQKPYTNQLERSREKRGVNRMSPNMLYP